LPAWSARLQRLFTFAATSAVNADPQAPRFRKHAGRWCGLMKEKQMVVYKSFAAALVAIASTLGAGAAHAGGHVSWSIGINTPIVGTVVTNAPVYYEPAPVYYQPAPVYYQPAPVYAPAPVYVSTPVYRAAPQVAYYPRYGAHYRPVPVAYPRYYRGGHPHHHARWETRGEWRRD
jgi:hypothetical protein